MTEPIAPYDTGELPAVKNVSHNPTAPVTLPEQATDGSAGFDLRADLGGTDRAVQIMPGTQYMVGTGYAWAIPAGWVGLVAIRSGLGTKTDLEVANKVGVIDSDYRGEVKVTLRNRGEKPIEIHHDQRIAQMVIVPYKRGPVVSMGELPDTTRGSGGFGSTGGV